MDLDEIKRGLRAEIKKRENEQYFTLQCNVRQMCKDVLAKLEEQESVIAELKADYQEACDRLQTANLIKDEQLAATRHSKYKRCLAMAKWCEERCARYDILQERTGFSWRREIDFYFRWSQRWLELAEKFKEVK
jgi:hypothetical protein